MHWDFIDYNANACIHCYEILILTYSNFTFDNVNIDLQKRSGLKYILQLLSICLVLNKLFFVVHNAFIKLQFVWSSEFIQKMTLTTKSHSSITEKESYNDKKSDRLATNHLEQELLHERKHYDSFLQQDNRSDYMTEFIKAV